MSDTGIFALLVTGRALHYGSALALFGYCVFNGVLMPDRREQSRVIKIGVWLFLLSALLWLAGEAAYVGDAVNASVLWSVLTATSFGQVFILQLVLALILLAVSRNLHAVAAVTGLSLAALAGLGHAVMLEGNALLPLAQAVHLLAAGFWTGGLLAIALKPAQTGADWRQALMRFSWIGHGAVALVILTGIAIGFVLLSNQPAPLNRIYLALLVAKATVVVLMTGFAVFNRYALVPRLPKAGDRLMQITRVNLALSATVILLVSFIGQLSPSIDPQ